MFKRTLTAIVLTASVSNSANAMGCAPKCPKECANVRGTCICPQQTFNNPITNLIISDGQTAGLCYDMSVADFLTISDALADDNGPIMESFRVWNDGGYELLSDDMLK